MQDSCKFLEETLWGRAFELQLRSGFPPVPHEHCSNHEATKALGGEIKK